MNYLGDERSPVRIFKRKSIYGDQRQELGFSSEKEFYEYIDKGANLLQQIMSEAGNASELNLKHNLITDPKDPNAGEDQLEIKKWEKTITVSVTNPANNNYDLSAITFGIQSNHTETDPVFQIRVDGPEDTAPDWDMLGAFTKETLDRLYKVLEFVISNRLHKPKA